MRFKFLLLAVLVGCQVSEPGEPYVAPVPTKKKIVEKLAPVEQRTTFDFFDNQSIRNRATTVYYLVAEDGTTVEVDMKTYAKVKVGSEYASFDWED